jgi:hypothetical protein
MWARRGATVVLVAAGMGVSISRPDSMASTQTVRHEGC